MKFLCTKRRDNGDVIASHRSTSDNAIQAIQKAAAHHRQGGIWTAYVEVVTKDVEAITEPATTTYRFKDPS